jgi:secondary thiamine-phosphate synthase enzyme
MPVRHFDFTVETGGYCHLEDVTGRVQECVERSGLKDGILCVHVVGSTAGVSTIEYEPGLRKDIEEFLERLLPAGKRYHHDDTWHDGNGFAHLRSFLMKTSLTVPFAGGRVVLGTWQQIVLADFDNRPRARRIVVQIVGE